MSLLPVMIVGSRVRVGVIGRGDGLNRRLDLLAKAGIEPQTLTADVVGPIQRSWPLLFVAGLDEKEVGRGWRKLRVPPAFSSMSRTCRISATFTFLPKSGAAICFWRFRPPAVRPGCARILREHLETLFGPEWDGILENVASARQQWRSEGMPPDEVSRRTRAMLDWLK